jgi:hypothetical protein
MFRGAFEQSLTVCADGPGVVSVAVSVGRNQAVAGPHETVTGAVEGAGWVVAPEKALNIDGKREPTPEPSADLPVPFFRSAQSSGEMKIVRSSTRCVLIDKFAISDADALKRRDFQVQNMSDITPLDSFFTDGDAYEGMVASHLNTASWTCSIPAGATGLRIRKLYDRFHGRQRARVLVDGEFAGWWYEPQEDRVTRWAYAETGIAARFLEGKSGVRLAIDPPPGTPLWSVSELETFALFSS